MNNAKAEVLAFAGFPQPHWRKIWSTNPYRLTGQHSGDSPPLREVLKVAGSEVDTG